MSNQDLAVVLNSHLGQVLAKYDEVVQFTPETTEKFEQLIRAGKFDKQKCLSSLHQWEKAVNSPKFEVRTIEECLTEKIPSLATLKKYRGEPYGFGIVAKLLANLAKFYNIRGNFEGHQIIETTRLIFKEYYMLNLKDLRLCFDLAKAGKFGKTYDRLDGAVVLDWMAQYQELRLMRSQQLSEKKHYDCKDVEFTEEAVENFQKILQYLKQKQIERKEREREEMEKKKRLKDQEQQDRLKAKSAMIEQLEKKYGKLEKPENYQEPQEIELPKPKNNLRQ